MLGISPIPFVQKSPRCPLIFYSTTICAKPSHTREESLDTDDNCWRQHYQSMSTKSNRIGAHAPILVSRFRRRQAPHPQGYSAPRVVATQGGVWVGSFFCIRGHITTTPKGAPGAASRSSGARHGNDSGKSRPGNRSVIPLPQKKYPLGRLSPKTNYSCRHFHHTCPIHRATLLR